MFSPARCTTPSQPSATANPPRGTRTASCPLVVRNGTRADPTKPVDPVIAILTLYTLRPTDHHFTHAWREIRANLPRLQPPSKTLPQQTVLDDLHRYPRLRPRLVRDAKPAANAVAFRECRVPFQ